MDTFETKPAVAAPLKRSWRRHSDEFRARVTELARQPNTSVAAVALANGLNANMLRRWVREAEASGGSVRRRAVRRSCACIRPTADKRDVGGSGIGGAGTRGRQHHG